MSPTATAQGSQSCNSGERHRRSGFGLAISSPPSASPDSGTSENSPRLRHRRHGSGAEYAGTNPASRSPRTAFNALLQSQLPSSIPLLTPPPWSPRQRREILRSTLQEALDVINGDFDENNDDEADYESDDIRS